MVLVSGFAGHVVLAPAHPWGLLASQHRPRGLPVRPPRGLPQNRAGVTPPSAAACWVMQPQCAPTPKPTALLDALATPVARGGVLTFTLQKAHPTSSTIQSDRMQHWYNGLNQKTKSTAFYLLSGFNSCLRIRHITTLYSFIP